MYPLAIISDLLPLWQSSIQSIERDFLDTIFIFILMKNIYYIIFFILKESTCFCFVGFLNIKLGYQCVENV